jgi:glycosyltransferase involved in cell wall biosynthesis
MRIGIDVREIESGVFTGIGRALMHFLRYFETADHADTCVLYSSGPLPFAFGPRIISRSLGAVPTVWFDEVRLPAALRRDGIDVFFSPYYKVPMAAGCAVIASVLDVMYLRYPPYREQMSLFRRMYYALAARQYVHRADRILTSSEFSRSDVAAVYGIDPARIEVLPLGVSQVYRPAENAQDIAVARMKFGINGRYLLYVGNFKKHKNVPALVEAFALVSGAVPDLCLVLAAPKKDHEGLLALASRLNVAQRLIFTGTITDENELRLLYAGAEVFVFPSLYEGFGIPPVEAMACGTPVVCSVATCLPETCAGAALMVDPLSPEDMARAVRRILGDDRVRQQLKSAGLERVRSIREFEFGRRMHDCCRAARKDQYGE